MSLPIVSRRAFLRLVTAVGIEAALCPTKSTLAQSTSEALIPENWTLGPYLASAKVTEQDRFDWETEFGNYRQHRRDFQKSLAATEGGNDTYAQRLQIYRQMIEVAKKIKDPYMQLASVNLFFMYALKDTARQRPKNGTPACANWVFPLEKTIGLGIGLCSEYATAIAAAMEDITGSQKSTYLLAMQVKPNADSHLVALTPIGSDIVISDAMTNLWPMLITDYFEHHWGFERWKPKALLNANGDALLVYDQASKDIAYKKKLIPSNPLAADKAACDEIVRLGQKSGALDRKSLQHLLAKNEAPAYIVAALR